MKNLESLLLEVLRRDLEVDAAQLIYSIGIHEKTVCSGSPSKFFVTQSPSDWEHESCLPILRYKNNECACESLYFGRSSSASILRIMRKGPEGSIPDQVSDKLILEHAKMHAALDKSYATELKKYQLRPIEAHALLLIALGLTAEEVAVQLGIGRRTVENHLKNAKEKLNAKTITEAVYRAIMDHQLGKM